MNCIAPPRVALRAAGLSCLLAFTAIAAGTPPAAAQVMIVMVRAAPPTLPFYDQPPLPEAGYIWTPGYWAWDENDNDYYWVPGTWVAPPSAGLLWTPGYWNCRNDVYSWVPGYWGRRVGFYGGLNYGYGYSGAGYQGGQWSGGGFSYNRTVNNFGNVNVTNTYEQQVTEDSATVTNVSYNGGTGGTTAIPNHEEQEAAHERHMMPTALQMQHQQTASTTPELHASANHGNPSIGGATYAMRLHGGMRGPTTAGHQMGHGQTGWPQHHGPMGGTGGHVPGTGWPQHHGPVGGMAGHAPGTGWQQPHGPVGGTAGHAPGNGWQQHHFPQVGGQRPSTTGVAPSGNWRPPGSFSPQRFGGNGGGGNFSAPNWGHRPSGFFAGGSGAGGGRPNAGRPSGGSAHFTPHGSGSHRR
jgi:hypothetical protein